MSAWSAPFGVLRGATAAGLWLPGPVAELAHPNLRSRRNVLVTRRLIPAEFVREVQGVRAAAPASAAAELAAHNDGRAEGPEPRERQRPPPGEGGGR